MAIRVGDIRRFVVLKKEHFKTVQRKKSSVNCEHHLRERSRLSFALKFSRSEAIFGVLSLYCLINLKIKQFNLCNKSVTIVK